ncbi:hypothetical protein GQ457_02G040360 [Hibiscus cannabinus]
MDMGEHHHICHHHPLYFNEDTSGPSYTTYDCACCTEKVLSSSYSCEECRFYVHKKCADAAYEIDHPDHRAHPLLLRPATEHQKREVDCSLCREKVKGFVYQCSSCEFYLDFHCALLSRDTAGNLIETIFVGHPHTLISINPIESFKCGGCGDSITGTSYACFDCGVFLHEKCLQLSAQISHPCHHKHQLTLVLDDFSKDVDDEPVCDMCRSKSPRGLSYRCAPCRFSIHAVCAWPEPIIEDKSLHPHPFTLLLRPNNPFHCSACGNQGNHVSYICSPCNIQVHKDCISLPHHIKLTLHPHPISHNFFNRIHHQDSRTWDCKICYKKVNIEYGSYSCSRPGCDFVIHVRCSIGKWGLFGMDKVKNPDELEEYDWLHEPMSCIVRVIKEIKVGDDMIAGEIEHVSHDHNLIFSEEIKDNKYCNGCVLPILTSYYYCSQCDFFLHKACAEVSRKHRSWFNADLFSLTTNGIFKCGVCSYKCNGFSYKSDDGYEVYICLRCALIPHAFTYQADKSHFIFFYLHHDGDCKACAEGLSFEVLYKCKDCPFSLHNRCITLPRTASHKCDVHSLTLAYQDPDDYPLRYYCDICEEERDPQRWLAGAWNGVTKDGASQALSCNGAMHHALAQLTSSSSDEQEIICTPNVNHNGNQFSELSSVEVVQALKSLRKQPGKALLLFNRLKEDGFSHDVWTYASIVRILDRCRRESELDSVFLEIIRKEKCLDFEVMDLFETLDEGLEGEDSKILVRLSNALVKAYVIVGMFDEAINILFQTRRRGFVPDILSCNFLMNRLIRCGKVDTTVAFYQQLNKLGFEPNDYTYAIVIKALCRKGSFEEAVDIFQEMDEAKVRPNACAYTTYIEGLCMHRRTDLGFKVLKAWREAKIPLDASAYVAVIKGFCDEMKPEEAEDVLCEAKNHGVVFDEFHYDALIKGYCNCGNIAKALDVHDEMKSKGIKTNCVIVTSILQCWHQMGLDFEVVNQFKKFRDTGMFLDVVCYNVVADALCKIGKVEEAVELIDEMKRKRISPDIIYYTTLINGYCLQDKMENALNLFNEMKENGQKFDIISYSVLAGGLARNGLKQEALNLLSDVEKQGMESKTVMYKVIIKGLCISGKVKEAEAFLVRLPKTFENYAALVDGYIEASLTKKAFELFLELSRLGFLPSKASCSKLLSCLCMDGYNDKALMLLEVMFALNVEPTKLMYCNLIGAFCQAGRLNKAQWLFDTMIDRGLTPDPVTYTIMQSSYCKANLLQEAATLFNNMKENGIEPDVITYTVLLNSHKKTNLRSLSGPDATPNTNKGKTVMDASTLWSEMKCKGVEPDVFCYTALIDHYFRTNNFQDAIRIFDEMTDAGLEPDNKTYTALISGYCKRGYIDKAKSLVNGMLNRGIQPDERTMSTLHHYLEKAKRIVRRSG